MVEIKLILILISCILLPIGLQVFGFRYILKNKELKIFSRYFLGRCVIALLLSIIIFTVTHLLAWVAGKDTYISVILLTLSGFIVNLFVWIFIFKSEKKSISLKSSLLASVFSLTAVFIVFVNSGLSNLPKKTVTIQKPEKFDNIFEDIFHNKSLRNILNGIKEKELLFQYSFVDGNNFGSSDAYLIEVYKSDNYVNLSHPLPFKISDRENFSVLFNLTDSDLVETSKITIDRFFKNVGHSNSRIYETINEIDLNFKKGSYSLSEIESEGNGLYTFKDVLISDKKNRLLIYICNSSTNYP